MLWDGSDAGEPQAGTGVMLSRAARLAEPLAAVTGPVPLRSGPAETHVLFLGCDKGSRGSGGLSLTLADSSGSLRVCCEAPEHSASRPAARLWHSEGASLCAACLAHTAQPLGHRGVVDASRDLFQE